MDSNIAHMKVRLTESRQKQSALQLKAKGLCRSIAPLVNPVLKPVEKMEIALAASQMDELVMVQAELLSLASQIEELEEALGN